MSSTVLETAIQIMVMAIVIAVILLFLGVGMLVLIHVCIVGRAFRRRFGNPERFDISSSRNRNRNRNRSMSQDDVQKLPCFDYNIAKDKGISSPVEDCAVCLENFKMGEKCRLLPLCRHSFHAECVDLWLLRNPICPICRTSVDSDKALGLVLGEESSHSSENVVELRESQSRESSHLDDVRIEVRNNQIREGSNLTDSGHESRENQINLVEIHSSFPIDTTTTTTTTTL